MGGMEFYSSANFYIQQWIEVSVEFDDPAVWPPTPGSKSHLYLLNGRLWGPQALSIDFGKQKDYYCQRGIKPLLLNCPTRTLLTIETELSGMPHVRVLFVLILCLRLYPYFVFCTKSYVLLTGWIATLLTFQRRIKSHLPFAGIIRSSPYSPRFQDNG